MAASLNVVGPRKTKSHMGVTMIVNDERTTIIVTAKGTSALTICANFGPKGAPALGPGTEHYFLLLFLLFVPAGAILFLLSRIYKQII